MCIRDRVRIANSYRFGKHTETLDSIDGQLSFFDEAESCCDLSVPEPAAEEVLPSRRDVYKRQGYSNVNDYSKYLQGKYHYMNTGTTSMQGIPTTVSVSSAFLQKCMNDPEKAKYLEENLAAIPDCTKDTINGCLGTVTNQSYMIDANGRCV